MSQAHRQSRGFHPIRAAARRWLAEGCCAHAGPGALVRGRQMSCTADVPTFGLARAPCRVCPLFLPQQLLKGPCDLIAPIPPAAVVIYSASCVTWWKGVSLGTGIGAYT